MDSKIRKERTLNNLEISIRKTLECAEYDGLYETWWEIPEQYIKRKTYFMLDSVIDIYKEKRIQSRI